MQIDGGRTFSEPTCIMTGKPEGLENVSDATTHVCLEPMLSHASLDNLQSKSCLHSHCRWWCEYMMLVSHQVCTFVQHFAVSAADWVTVAHAFPISSSQCLYHVTCVSAEVLGSLKCDCAEQLKLAMEYIQEHDNGIIIYLQQEGRGIGLSNKIAAYSLQETGLDTVDANRALGLPDDCREYTSVTNILANLGVKSIHLMTNNPRKIELLRATGVQVADRIPCIVKAQPYSKNYLEVKQSKMAHDFDGSYCYWNHDGSALLPGTQLAVDPQATMNKQTPPNREES
ncbi:TPA: hypothetical protein ACH3X1_001955 [Trebouxia sp. C0004]